MTIGIAASGPRAGLAVFRALEAVERVATGAIGGFCAFAATGDGRLHRCEVQRGGATTLFVEGERTGVPPPPEVAAATVAGLMSSGPDRPVPLSQFVAADASGVLVSGHRLPNNPGGERAVNQEALDLLLEGVPAEDAVRRVLDAWPECDAGLIAVDRDGGVFALNSARVARRFDLGHAGRARGGARVEVLCNAMVPPMGLAALAAEVAIEVMAPALSPDGYLEAGHGVPVEVGEDSVLVDDSLRVRRVLTSDRRLVDGDRGGSALYLGAPVHQDGRLLGWVLSEAYCTIRAGRIVAYSGQQQCRVAYRRAP